MVKISENELQISAENVPKELQSRPGVDEDLTAAMADTPKLQVSSAASSRSSWSSLMISSTVVLISVLR